jgi:ribose-phosphate pyrophosphokinase
MSTTPWEKDERAWRKVPQFTVANSSVLDEIGQFKYTGYNTELEYEVKDYPDMSKYVIVKSISNKLTFRINHYEDLWILNQIHDVVKSSGWTVTVIIPNLIDAQADRRFAIDQPHGLKLVCEFLNSLSNFRYKIYHPHNPEVVEALIDSVEIIDNSEFIEKALKQIDKETLQIQGKLILMSSDAGGFKPLMKMCDKINWQGETYSASKSRKYEEGHSKLIQNIDRPDFGGKDILIVDDICVFGGTFKGLSKLLKQKNCGKLYLAVSHLTVNDLGNDPVTNYFDKVFTTNSKFDSDRYMSWDHDIHKQLVVIDLF